MATYTGTAGDNRAEGGFDRMYGLAGEDTLLSQWKGRVYLDGGDGDDDLETEDGAWGEFYGGAGNDLITGGNTLNVDTILGGAGDDVVWGDLRAWPPLGAADLIDGGEGRDALMGDLGNDTIYGGDGDDSGAEFSRPVPVAISTCRVSAAGAATTISTAATATTRSAVTQATTA